MVTITLDPTINKREIHSLFYTVEEVSIILKTSKMTVNRMIHAGDLVAVMIGGKWRIRVDTFEYYLRSLGLPDSRGSVHDVRTERVG
jgi:excisionase family DNA binding protein